MRLKEFYLSSCIEDL